MCEIMGDREYFRAYRNALGFTNQQSAKEFLSGKDVSAGIDFDYIEQLIERLSTIVTNVNASIHPSLRHQNIEEFCSSHITDVYSTVRDTENLPRLNNQGRRPEQVLYSWLRGYAMTRFLHPALASLFNLEQTEIYDVGDDDFRSLETFRRTPKADLTLNYNNRSL